ncbi:unnamed protein product, partial [marine sediment metagenome]
LEEITNFTKEQARAIVESGEEHQPIMLVLNSEGVNLVYLVEIKKDRFKQYITGLLRKLNAYAYIFVNEAWGTKLDKDSITAKDYKLVQVWYINRDWRARAAVDEAVKYITN